MKSPFPGMDPFIETPSLWGDFHHELIANLKREIADRLPERYIVQTNVRSYVELVEAESKETPHFEPDVSLLGPVASLVAQTQPPPMAVAEPGTEEEVMLRAFVAEEFKEAFVEIFYQEDESILVTCLEVLSPSNKRRDSQG